MYRTTYKSNNPKLVVNPRWPDDFTDVEYRQVILKTPHPTPPEGRYLLEVRHGWWDEPNKEALGKRPLISSPFETWDEAETAFKRPRR